MHVVYVLYVLYFWALVAADAVSSADAVPLAAPVIVVTVTTLHFAVGALSLLSEKQSVGQSVRQRYTGGAGILNLFSDALITAALVLAALLCTGDYFSSGPVRVNWVTLSLATVGNSFCLLGI